MAQSRFPDSWRKLAIPKKNKYRSISRVLDGIKFPSKKEARRYSQLKLLQRAGEITDLIVHRRYSIDVNDCHVCIYEADFSYMEKWREADPQRGHGLEGWRMVVEDVKGFRTKEFKLKKKLMRAVHGIEVRET